MQTVWQISPIKPGIASAVHVDRRGIVVATVERRRIRVPSVAVGVGTKLTRSTGELVDANGLYFHAFA